MPKIPETDRMLDFLSSKKQLVKIFLTDTSKTPPLPAESSKLLKRGGNPDCAEPHCLVSTGGGRRGHPDQQRRGRHRKALPGLFRRADRAEYEGVKLFWAAMGHLWCFILENGLEFLFLGIFER